MINNLTNNATKANQNNNNTDKGLSDKDFNDLFSQALFQVYTSNKIFNERIGNSPLKEEIDKIIRD